MVITLSSIDHQEPYRSGLYLGHSQVKSKWRGLIKCLVLREGALQQFLEVSLGDLLQI